MLEWASRKLRRLRGQRFVTVRLIDMGERGVLVETTHDAPEGSTVRRLGRLMVDSVRRSSTPCVTCSWSEVVEALRRKASDGD